MKPTNGISLFKTETVHFEFTPLLLVDIEGELTITVVVVVVDGEGDVIVVVPVVGITRPIGLVEVTSLEVCPLAGDKSSSSSFETQSSKTPVGEDGPSDEAKELGGLLQMRELLRELPGLKPEVLICPF